MRLEASSKAYFEQTAEELEGNLLGGVCEEGLGQRGEVLDERGGYGGWLRVKSKILKSKLKLVADKVAKKSLAVKTCAIGALAMVTTSRAWNPETFSGS